MTNYNCNCNQVTEGKIGKHNIAHNEQNITCHPFVILSCVHIQYARENQTSQTLQLHVSKICQPTFDSLASVDRMFGTH